MVRISAAPVVIGLVVATTLAGSTEAWAQTRTQPAVAPGRFDIAVTAPFTQIATSGDEKRTWSGPAAALVVDGNVSPHLALATSIETRSGPGIGALIGCQISTGYFYGNNRDPVPGRFFGKLLAGVSRTRGNSAHPAGQFDVGADILLSRSGAVAFRWEVGYEITLADEPHAVNGRAALGLVFGGRS
jgi:hypothetical protein